MRVGLRLGFSHVWEVEHHFLEEYSHSSAPEVFLAAVSQRTRTSGSVTASSRPPGYNHPARTAERIATLDLISDGRVDFGFRRIEFGVRTRRVQHRPRCQARTMARRSRNGAAMHDRGTLHRPSEGKYVSMPPRNVVPKPLQKPHPPLWVACSRRDTILMAAELGLGALSFAFIEPEEAAGWVKDYEQVLTEKCVPIGQAINPQIACVSTMMCHNDEAEAVKARPGRRELLRLLPGSLLRLRRSQARSNRCLVRVPGQATRARVFT